MAHHGIERISEFRRRFLSEGLRLTNGHGWPATAQGPGSGQPQVVATAFCLPVATRALPDPILSDPIRWLLQRQLPSGAFTAARPEHGPSRLATALACGALWQLHGPQVSPDIARARRRAGDWMLTEIESDRDAELDAETRSAELAALSAYARSVDRPEILLALLGQAERALERLAQAGPTGDRLWLARGLVEAFETTGEIPMLEAVRSTLDGLEATLDPAGRIAATPSAPGGDRAGSWAQALFTSLATRAHRPDPCGVGVTGLARALGPDGLPPAPGAAGPTTGVTGLPGSPVIVAMLLHDALCDFAGAVTRTHEILVTRTAPSLSSGRGNGTAETAPPEDGDPTRPPRVVSLSSDTPDAVAPHRRLHAALNALARRGRISYRSAIEARDPYVIADPSRLDSVDVMVRHRFALTPEVAESARCLLESRSTPLIFDVDEFGLGLPQLPGLPPFDIEEVFEAVRTATVVTAPTEFVAQGLQEQGADQVVVIPDAIDPDDWPEPDLSQPTRESRASEATPFRVLCAGTATTPEDLECIRPVLEYLRHRFGHHLAFYHDGACSSAFADLCRGSADLFTAPSVSAHVRALQEPGFDLVLAPLADSPASRCRGYRRWLDCSAAGIPGVYARLGGNPEVIREGEDGFLASPDPGAWAEPVAALIGSPERRREMAAAASARVRRDFTIERVLPVWEMAIDLARRGRPGFWVGPRAGGDDPARTTPEAPNLHVVAAPSAVGSVGPIGQETEQSIPRAA